MFLLAPIVQFFNFHAAYFLFYLTNASYGTPLKWQVPLPFSTFLTFCRWSLQNTSDITGVSAESEVCRTAEFDLGEVCLTSADARQIYLAQVISYNILVSTASLFVRESSIHIEFLDHYQRLWIDPHHMTKWIPFRDLLILNKILIPFLEPIV